MFLPLIHLYTTFQVAIVYLDDVYASQDFFATFSALGLSSVVASPRLTAVTFTEDAESLLVAVHQATQVWMGQFYNASGVGMVWTRGMLR